MFLDIKDINWFLFCLCVGLWIFIIGIGVKYEFFVVKDYGGFLYFLVVVVFRLWSLNYKVGYYYMSFSNCFRGYFWYSYIKLEWVFLKKNLSVMWLLDWYNSCVGIGMGLIFNLFCWNLF